MKNNFTYFLVAACIIVCGYLSIRYAGVYPKQFSGDVVIIDKSLQNYQALAKATEKSSRVILVEDSNQGFSELEGKIKDLRGVERLHILTHGTSGNLILGRQQLDGQNIGKFNRFWEYVSKSFASEKSQLLIYSCQLASDRAGEKFIDTLHGLLHVAVAGSADNTGNARKGGNWVLEYVAGNIMKQHMLEFLDFDGLLIPYFSKLSGSGSPFFGIKISTDDQLIYGDFDADGDIDIHSWDGTSTTNDFWRNNGSGSFQKVTGSASPFENVTENAVFYAANLAFVADWDNDGDDDIYVTMRDRNKNEKNLFYRNNNGKYALLSGGASPFANVTVSGDNQLIFGDFDNDGDIDLHTYPGNNQDSEFWRNNGSGMFTKITGTQNPFNNLPGKAAFSLAQYTYVADWDNDGDPDILTTKKGSTSVREYYRNDNGVYALQTGSANPFNNMAIATDNQILFGDFDADGDIDLHTSNGSATLIFWRNNGSGTFTQVTGAENPFSTLTNNGAFYNNAKKAFVADWDNDKDADIFTAYYDDTQQNYFFRQNDAPPFISATSPANLATGVSVSGNISLTFSRPVSGVNGKNIQIRRMSDNSIFATIPANGGQVSGNGTATITINPAADLEGSTNYYLTIDKAAFADADGRIFSGVTTNNILRFTTGAAPTVAAVTTTQVSNIAQTTATMGGNVTNDGNSPVTDLGIVWSTSPAPTVSANKIQNGSGTGSFSAAVTSLPAGSHIYVRAYVINQVGTAYGNEVDFYTKTAVTAISRLGTSPTSAGQVSYTITFANNITGLDVTDFSLVTSGLTGAVVSSVSGSGNNYTVGINTGSGNGTIRLNFTAINGTQPAVISGYTSAAEINIYKVSTPSDYYSTTSSNADWNTQTSWESSPDNSFWIQATSFPNAANAMVSVVGGQTINLPAGFSTTAGNLSNEGIISLNSNSVSVSGTLTNNGTLKGNGTFVNNTFSNSGIIAPGNSAGTISFTGNVVNNGVINIELGGSTAGSGYDQLKVTGSISLSGTLNVVFINGYSPVAGDEFTIIDAASSTGSFTTANLPDITPRQWQTSYDNASGNLVLKVINDPLPVTLVKFTVSKKEATAVLSWASAQETNSSHFEIQRSSHGISWQAIGSVKVSASSVAYKAYEYVDVNPMNGENLYRLKMIDLDGTFAYSGIRSVNFAQKPIEISLFPNPVSSRLLINMKDPASIQGLAIYNTSGMQVNTWNSYSPDGIPVSTLSTGIYVLKITTVGGHTVHYKFQKE